MRRRTVERVGVCAAASVGLLLAGCGSGTSSSSTAGGTPAARVSAGEPVDGGTLRASIADNPDHLDSGLSYATEGWEILEATGNGLLTFKKAAGGEGAQIVPDLATAMPRVSADGRTYSFTMRTGVMFSAPVSREVEPSDVKFAIERLFRVDSGGVGFYTGIVGADAYAKSRRGGISGIVADDAEHTLSFKLTQPDGTFLDYLAIPFAFAVPAGTPDRDISTDARWRVATGPYRITAYVPKDHITLARNPSFRSWSPDVPAGHLDAVDIAIGTTPEAAVDQIAQGSLDWSFSGVPPDRLTELKARFPGQVQVNARNNITYYSMNTRKPPFDSLAVRQAVNDATDRNALVKLFGGQGTPTENLLPPTIGPAYVKQDPYPYDLAKAKALVAASGTAGMAVTVESHSTDPVPKTAQYMASVLDSLGYKATVKTLDEGIYFDTIAGEKADPQMAFVQFDQDYPEPQDFLDVQLNGEHIVDVGNQVFSNLDVPAIDRAMDAAKQLPPGSGRDAAWAGLDRTIMTTQAPWVPFINLTLPKYVSPKLHGLVFNGTYYEMFPEMWLSK